MRSRGRIIGFMLMSALLVALFGAYLIVCIWEAVEAWRREAAAARCERAEPSD